MEIIKYKLDKITSFWNFHLWDVKETQREIRFDKDVRTNYYGDILKYFTDTLDLLKIPENISSDFRDNIISSIGLLQIIYVQQDLIDELLQIFKLEKSSKSDKNPNRDIRNELVGHPINRDRNRKLKSSVFFGTGLSKSKLHYIRYDRKNSFKVESLKYDFHAIVERHKDFLNKYLDLIWDKVISILESYKNKLIDFENALDNKIPFKEILQLTEKLLAGIFENRYIYRKDYLLEYLKRQKEHKRYKNAIELFKSELINSIKETIKNIEDLINAEFEEKPKPESSEGDYKIILKPLRESQEIGDKKDYDYHYELEKLHDRKLIFGFSDLKDRFSGNKVIREELENMEKHYYNDLEYYCSFELIKKEIESNL